MPAATPEWHAEINEQTGLKQQDLPFDMMRDKLRDKSKRQNIEKKGKTVMRTEAMFDV